MCELVGGWASVSGRERVSDLVCVRERVCVCGFVLMTKREKLRVREAEKERVHMCLRERALVG